MKSIYRALACLIIVLAVPATAVADESLGNSVIANRFDAQAARIGDLETENASLKSRLEALESLLAGVSRGADPQTNQDTLQFSSMNVQIVNGTGVSDLNSTPNGTGNLIVGYNEPNTTGQPNERTGSHMLVVGFGQNYTSYGGIVAGVDNTVRGRYGSVFGGTENTARGLATSVVGGKLNEAGGFATVIGGGLNNLARGPFSAILGGADNITNSFRATIAGGQQNSVDGFAATVSGGFGNGAFNDFSTVSGGRFNIAVATGATVGGGLENVAGGEDATVSGGYRNGALGAKSSVAGGQFKTAGSEACVAGDSVPDGGGC